MPKVTRRRMIDAPARSVWNVVSDPYHLPRWWPRTARVESVKGAGAGAMWTQVLETKDGRAVRADYRCTDAEDDSRFAFEQLVEDSPFERVLRSSTTEVRIEPAATGSEVSLIQEQKLRGLSRFGAPMMRRASGRILDGALEGLETAVAGEPG
jgi:uncharacterized protein YndB with AHSA1/START domain